MQKRKYLLLGLISVVLATTAVFAGDIEMKINGATDAVTIDKSDGSEAMRVTADGKVGIGEDAPSASLDIKNGNVEIKHWTNLGPGPAGYTYLGMGLKYENSVWKSFNASVRGSALRFSHSKINFSSADANTDNATLVDHMTVDTNTGNVGIGTITPAGKIHVKAAEVGDNVSDTSLISNLHARASASNDSYLRTSLRRHTAGNNWFGTQMRIQKTIDSTAMGFIDFGIDGQNQSYGLGFGSGATTHMTVESSGNVRIGPSTANAKLNLYGDGTTVGSAAINFDQPSGNNGFSIGLGTTDNKLHFGDSWNPESSTHMTIQENGNVGIGTKTPLTKLHVDGIIHGRINSLDNRAVVTTPETLDTRGVEFNFKQNSTNGLNDGHLYNGVMTYRIYGSNSDWSGGPAHQMSFTANGRLFHRYGSQTTWKDWQRIIEEDQNGNVGIGTTSPTTKLAVKLNSTTEVRVHQSTSGGLWGTNAAGNFHIDSDASKSTGDIYINYYDGKNVRIYGGSSSVLTAFFRADGNVGIGTTSPSQKLHVNGTALAIAHTTTSDRRLKTNFTPITSALDKISQINGVEFDWNELSKQEGKHDLGVIAQEVKAVFPQFVNQGSDGYYSVDYAKLAAPMIEAIKELRAEKDSEINELREMNEILKAEICILNPSSKICK